MSTTPSSESGLGPTPKTTVLGATAVIFAWTALSRVLGFAREQVIAAYFGASGATDAIVAGTTVSLVVMATLAGGLGTAVVPYLTELKSGGRDDEARVVAGGVLTQALGVFALISIAGVVFAREIVAWTLPGLEGEAAELAVVSTRLSFAGTAFFGLGGASRGIINSYHQFGVPAAAPAVGNVFTIAAIVALARVGALAGAAGLALGQLAGWGLQAIDLIRKGIFPVSFGWLGSPSARRAGWRIWSMAIPVALATSVGSAIHLVDRWLASGLTPGSIAALNFADRLRQVPLGLFTVALTTAVLPNLSEVYARGDRSGFAASVSQGLRLLSLVMIPTAFGLMALDLPLVRLLFEHGVFTTEASVLTAAALFGYAPGLIAFSAHAVLASAFFATNDSRTPLMVGLGMLISNVILDFVLVRMFGVGGIAWANSLALFGGAAAMIWLLKRRLGDAGRAGDEDLLGGAMARALVKMTIASLVMAAVVFLVADWMGAFDLSRKVRDLVIPVTAASAAGAVAFVGAAFGLRIEEASILVGKVKAKFG